MSEGLKPTPRACTWTHADHRAARESTYEFLKMYSRAHGCQLTEEYLDEDMAASLSARREQSYPRDVLQCQQDVLQHQHVVSSKRTKR